ncbi:unnamed protein product [Acanthoscelides obtectus]|uniref:Uncharacterized protein n=1 Tax=Acanthoscelides obtectus TaxID=200917 RepID=A0A9P0JH81_ACAOB|nr:unnamed protein product [Acanthoscelides obtectus]CAK1639905.1 hypothetical protein AOBTE_LOCUS11440 [Acanthoscelides obtectus]
MSASCFSLHIEENNRAIIEERKQDRKFSEIIVSCRSLSHYEGRTFKTLLPQVSTKTLIHHIHPDIILVRK